jgi:hypothetical protein
MSKENIKLLMFFSLLFGIAQLITSEYEEYRLSSLTRKIDNFIEQDD